MPPRQSVMSTDFFPWRLTRKQWAAAAVAAAALAGVIWSVVYQSDTERIDGLIESGVSALERGNVEAVMEDVSPDFRSYGIGRAQLRKLLQEAVERYGQPDLSALKKQFTIGDGNASCQFTLLATGGRRRRPIRTRWVASFRKRDAQWNLTGIRAKGRLGNRLERAKELAGDLGIDLDEMNR